jgi:hypothetical protein
MVRNVLLAVLLLILPIATAEALEIAEFGGFPDGTYTAPALNTAIYMAASGPDKTIHFGAGSYTFATRPNALHDQVRLVGEGWYATKPVRAYTSGGCFIEGRGVGLYVKDLALWAAPGTSGGTALNFVASNAIGPGGKHVIENVRILEGTVDCISAGCPFGSSVSASAWTGLTEPRRPRGFVQFTCGTSSSGAQRSVLCSGGTAARASGTAAGPTRAGGPTRRWWSAARYRPRIVSTPG